MKYHISKNTQRPNICKAEIRDCPLGENEPHFITKEEARVHVEKINEDSMSMFPTTQKSITTSLPQAMLHEEYFAKYTKNSSGKDSPEYAAIAAEVVKATVPTEFNRAKFKKFDDEWQEKSSSHVERIKLSKKQRGYYKSVPINFKLGNAVDSYDASSLKCAISEVRAYNVAQILGLDGLVPETTLKELPDGDFGSLQEEVITAETEISVIGPSELKKASLFDFITGSQDRHDGNFIISYHDGDYRLKLIDNGYSFPSKSSDFFYNQSMFVGIHESDHFDYPAVTLTEDDTQKLKEIRESEQFKKLSSQFTKEEYAGVKARMAFLIEHEVVPSWENYFEAQSDPNYNIRKELGLN